MLRARSILLIVLTLCIITVCPASALAQAKMATADEIVAIYGAPDLIESSENETPRPVFISRWFTYKSAGVKLMFLADTPQKWVLVEAIDLKSGTPLPAQEVKRRLKNR
jgi:hypothetical protein